MGLFNRMQRFDGFELDWKRLIILSTCVLLIGLSLTITSIIRPDIKILGATGFSLLPLSGILILSLGLLECLDAFLAKEQREVLQNLQVGVLDTVVGIFIVTSVSGHAQDISILIAAFLIVRGTVRITLAKAMKLPRTLETVLCGLVSVILGVCVWLSWPTTDSWFLSFCLNAEIAARGWAMTSFALWIKNQN
ncbi:MAG: hypothetical protein PSN04_04640 [Methyloprofundus sp.]|nr:hypothetical protein [Methyloprofundus sp.]